MSAVALGVMAVGGLVGAASTVRKGKMSRALGRARKKESKKVAIQEVAVGQRKAAEQKRQAEYLASRALAVAAAGGGSTDDPTVTKIIADIEGEGAYRAAVEMYDAEEKAKKLRFEGRMAEFVGEEEYEASKTDALTGLLSTGASLYSAGNRRG